MSGIYIHIPFCKQKCSYCDFHFSTSFSAYRKKMIDSLSEEIILRKDYLNGENLNSIYFGGGTPSLLEEDELQQIIKTIHSHFKLNQSAEITLEANPDDIDESRLNFWKNAGINRLSIGIQSFKKEDLEWMNRAHSVEEGLNSVRLAKRAGIENITIDLIYGLPGLSSKEWKGHIEKAINLGVQHISAYCLTIEKRTALHAMVKKRKIIPAGEDQQSDQFTMLVETMLENGFEQYEISNFAKEQHYAVHNTSYWLGKNYLGIGPSAHSFNGNERRWNVSNNTVYMKSVGINQDWYDMEILSSKERWNELILTGLRTKFGVDLELLSCFAPLSSEFNEKVSQYEQDGLLVKENNKLLLTTNGRLKADYISSELFL